MRNYQIMQTYHFTKYQCTIGTTELINEKIHRFYMWLIFTEDSHYQQFIKFKTYVEILEKYYKYDIHIVKCSEINKKTS